MSVRTVSVGICGSRTRPARFPLYDNYTLKDAYTAFPLPDIKCHPAALICSLSALCWVCWLLYSQNIFLCCTHSVMTVIGKDHDSLSSWWTFNETLFMLQPQRERAEKRQAGPSRRAVWDWKHFEVKDQLRGLITHLCCHSCQFPNQSEKEIQSWAWLQFSDTPKALIISRNHLWPLSTVVRRVVLFCPQKHPPPWPHAFTIHVI